MGSASWPLVTLLDAQRTAESRAASLAALPENLRNRASNLLSPLIPSVPNDGCEVCADDGADRLAVRVVEWQRHGEHHDMRVCAGHVQHALAEADLDDEGCEHYADWVTESDPTWISVWNAWFSAALDIPAPADVVDGLEATAAIELIRRYYADSQQWEAA